MIKEINLKTMNTLVIICKWKILRYLCKQRIISYRKMMVRMHYIQQLRGLYDFNKLIKMSYKKLKKLFIQNYPDAYIHNIKDFKSK
jgi:hypothetical protein